MSVGAELAQARQRLDLSLEELSERTKIKVERLAALEEMDSDALPPFVYLKGFVKAYATEVGLDAEDVAQRYVDEAGVLPAFSAPTETERELVASSLAELDRAEAADAGVPENDAEADLEPERASAAAERRAEPIFFAVAEVPRPGSSQADVPSTTSVAAAPLAPLPHDPPPDAISMKPMIIATLLSVLAGFLIAAVS